MRTESSRMKAMQAEFRAREARELERLEARARRNRRNGTIAGAAVAFAAVLATAGVTRKSWFWHSCLLEAVLCALAGFLLARSGGGFLRGVLLFSGAYLFAHLLRAIGLDPSVVFDAGDMRRGLAVQGNFLSLIIVITCGGLIGLVMRD